MEAKDTIRHNVGCFAAGYMTGGYLRDNEVHYECTCGRVEQAEVSFQAGINEVVEWLKASEYTGIFSSKYFLMVDSRNWQAQKKKWGIE